MTDSDWSTLMAAVPTSTSNILHHPTKNYFWQQWVASGISSQRKTYINQSAVQAVFAYNSPADTNVPPSAYLPLHDLLDDITRPISDLRGLSSVPYGGAFSYPHDPTKLRTMTSVVPDMHHTGWSIHGWSPQGLAAGLLLFYFASMGALSADWCVSSRV